MSTPTTPADDVANRLITTAASKLAQIQAIDQQSKQYQANLDAWSTQRATLVQEVGQIKAAIVAGTDWTPAQA